MAARIVRLHRAIAPVLTALLMAGGGAALGQVTASGVPETTEPAAVLTPAPTEAPIAVAAPAVAVTKPKPSAKPVVVPTTRPRYDVAIIQALDKVTAESFRFEAGVGQPVRYRNLVVTVKACEQTLDDEAVSDYIAYLTIDSQPKAAPGKPTPPPRQAFKGWMYASSPGLNPLQHPVYDAWLISCRAAAPDSGAR